MSASATDTAVAAIALLGDPNRRRLYDLVTSRQTPVGRDEAARALGMSRELAAFHLDRLVDGGLLETEYRRLSGRSGPGAGRPAKLYRRADDELAVSLPARDYQRVAEVFADALERLDGRGAAASAAVASVARARGAALAREARRSGAVAPSVDHASLLALLRSAGFEPRVDPADGSIRLANCPYRSLAERQRELTCGMNLAWAAGLLDGLQERSLEAELSPEPGRCCVIFRPAGASVSGRFTPRTRPGTG
jgi:predicted ArsR family transcriptional regulator